MNIATNTTTGGSHWPPLDLATAIERKPPALDFVLPGLVAGTVGAIVAPGATGKSWLALELLALVAAGVDLLGFGTVPRGRVVLLAAEDPGPVLHQRVHALATHLSPAAREDFIENATILSCLGTAGDLLDGGETAARIEHVAAGARLVIIDTLSRWHTGEENDRRDAAQVMRTLERVAAHTDATILFLHHTSKAAALDGNGDKQQAARGSSVFVDESRWVAFLATCSQSEAEQFSIDEEMRRNFVRFGVSKANYVAPQADIWLRREAGGVLARYEYEMRSSSKRAVTKQKAKVNDDNDF